jgi:uncharacterized membrane protein
MASLIAAVMTMGIVAGVFQLYAYAIMPGLGRTDDRTLVGAFQQIGGAMINPYFMFGFVGALVFTALAAVLHVGADERSVLPWAVRGACPLSRRVCHHTRGHCAAQRWGKSGGEPRPNR